MGASYVEINGSMSFDFNNAAISLISFKNRECFGDFFVCRFSNDLILSDDFDVSALPLPNRSS